MDRNAYQSELDQVQFTEAGRSALTDALMAEQAGPPVQHRSLWMKRGMAAVLAAVLLVGTAAAVTASLWDSFSADWTRGSRRWWTPSAAACRVRSPQAEP
ncbi:MAG: hypothetical protein ACLVBB_10650 [Dysosmobacter welbionis]